MKYSHWELLLEIYRYQHSNTRMLEVQANKNLMKTYLFHKIMRELNVLYGNPDEYIRDEYNEDAPFKNQRGVTQHMIRLGKFVHKYAKDYLPEDVANSFIREVEQYINW
ncbi:hypothetical protein [Metabacillus niabensis]|uniref:hypothetical protein n=1 Tax=Metabacillus niabensis TaxID=324854 RepID=UPI0039A28175